jgi:alpha-L-fucosidase 2
MDRKRLNSTQRIVLLITVLVSVSAWAQKAENNNSFWYEQPAENWMQALPVGNGRLGAMVFGDPHNERIQLNEDSLWPGGPDWGDSKGNAEDLKEIRQLVNKGEAHKADKLIVEKFSYKSVIRSHQTLGDLFIDFENKKKTGNYSRRLSLDDALVTVNYTSGGNRYSERVFSSAPDDVLVIELSTTDQNGMNFTLRLNRPKDKGHETVQLATPSDNEITMNGMVTQYGGKKLSKPFPVNYGVKFESRLKVRINSGSVAAKNGALILKGVKKATLFLVASTSFYHDNYKEKNTQTLQKLNNRSFDELLNRHVADYRKYYKRVSLDLSGHELNSMPTDKRLKRIKNGKDDPDLAAKLFQYGRYLLISSSRPGTNPANLQGIWNKDIQAPWNADYHLNINLQMNYWPAEVTNLSELHQPFFDLLDRVENGANILPESSTVLTEVQ